MLLFDLIMSQKNTPDRAPTIPAIVGIVALETPEAIDLAFPEPEMAITSNTIIPVTVPINPSTDKEHKGLDDG